MIDYGAAFDLAIKALTDPSGGVQVVRDVSALVGGYQAAKSGKISLGALTRAQALSYLHENQRVTTLAIKLLEDPAEGENNFAEIKALMAALG